MYDLSPFEELVWQLIEKLIQVNKDRHEACKKGKRLLFIESGSTEDFRNGKKQTKSEKELWKFLTGLPARDLILIQTLRYLGRQDFGPEEFEERYKSEKGMWSGVEEAARGLMCTMNLPFWLYSGLMYSTEVPIDFEKLIVM